MGVHLWNCAKEYVTSILNISPINAWPYLLSAVELLISQHPDSSARINVYNSVWIGVQHSTRFSCLLHQLLQGKYRALKVGVGRLKTSFYSPSAAAEWFSLADEICFPYLHIAQYILYDHDSRISLVLIYLVCTSYNLHTTVGLPFLILVGLGLLEQ